MLFRTFTFCLFFFICGLHIQAASVKGKLTFDETWAPVVYLSVIYDFDDLQTASYDFLRFQTQLDSTGYFEFINLDLPEVDLVYRLHICKKGDPVSTILIGGQEENFIHFIMNKNAQITISASEKAQGLADYHIQGDPSGNSLSRLFGLQKRLNTPLDLPSENNRVFVKKQVYNEFQKIIDTTSNSVIPLLALHFIGESYANESHLELMEKVKNDLEYLGESSPYYEDLIEEIQFLEFQFGVTNSPNKIAWLKWLGLLLLIPFAGFLWWKINTDQNEKQNKVDPKFNQLSRQEKRVYHLLKSGKSNKEISSELHIEVSTVKSHLHKIYSRLGVKSRNEIINRER